jgi:hypothetical protein
MTRGAGYFGGGDWVQMRRTLPHFRDGHVHIAHYVSFSWAEANPAEGVYNWELLDEKVRSATAQPDEGFVFWIQCYGRYNYTRWKWARSEEDRQDILKSTCMVPQWAIERGNVRFLSNGAVAAWEPECRYQEYFGKFLRALGERYRNHPKLIGVDMRGLDCRYGEWCWLREGYRARWAGHKPVRNFERWLLQRDVAPDGRNVPTDKVDISSLTYNYPSGRGYEFHARCSDLAHGSRHIYFRVERQFLSGGPYRVLLKVTYLDGQRTTWCLEYSSPNGVVQSPPVETAATGAQRTVTIDIPDMQVAAAFRGQVDFRLTVLGEADLTVKFVRLLRAEPPAGA